MSKIAFFKKNQKRAKCSKKNRADGLTVVAVVVVPVHVVRVEVHVPRVVRVVRVERTRPIVAVVARVVQVIVVAIARRGEKSASTKNRQSSDTDTDTNFQNEKAYLHFTLRFTTPCNRLPLNLPRFHYIFILSFCANLCLISAKNSIHSIGERLSIGNISTCCIIPVGDTG